MKVIFDDMREINLNAIDKIIARKSLRDYKAAWGKLTKAQKRAVNEGRRHFSYNLGDDTREAIDVKHDYLDGKITEEEYKAYCLRVNLVEG